jgi:hypothetical protein
MTTLDESLKDVLSKIGKDLKEEYGHSAKCLDNDLAKADCDYLEDIEESISAVITNELYDHIAGDSFLNFSDGIECLFKHIIRDTLSIRNEWLTDTFSEMQDAIKEMHTEECDSFAKTLDSDSLDKCEKLQSLLDLSHELEDL